MMFLRNILDHLLLVFEEAHKVVLKGTVPLLDDCLFNLDCCVLLVLWLLVRGDDILEEVAKSMG